MITIITITINHNSFSEQSTIYSLDALTKCTNYHGIRRIFFDVVLYFFVQHRLTQTLMSLTENKHIVIRKAISFVFGVILSFVMKERGG